MNTLLLGAGALVLIAMAKQSSATETEGGLTDDELTFLQTIPRNLVKSSMPSKVFVAEQGNSMPSLSLVGVNSYADFRYVTNALDAMGYNTDIITNEAINACVYRVSCYTWYYAFKAIANDDVNLTLTDSGAYAVIDEWIKTFGYNTISGVAKRGNICPPMCDVRNERNKLSPYSSSLQQDYYLLGTKDGTTTSGATGGTGDVSEYQWVIELVGLITDAISWLKENDWFGWFGDDAAVVKSWLEEIGVTTIGDLGDQQTESDAETIVQSIDFQHDYWTAAVWMHKYIVSHPDLLPEMWPIYKY